MVYSQYEEQIWNALNAVIQNDYGTAALMGNLNAESNLFPGRVQGDFSSGYSYSVQYTAQLNGGQISQNDFVYHGPNGGGYGLAQWTYYTRKQNYWYEFGGSHGNAGTVEFECWFLLQELQTDYIDVLNVLRSATNIRTASDYVLVHFENPADQSESVKRARAAMGQNLYDAYHGTSPDPPTPPTPSGDGTLMAILYMGAKKKKGIFIFEKRWYKK